MIDDDSLRPEHRLTCYTQQYHHTTAVVPQGQNFHLCKSEQLPSTQQVLITGMSPHPTIRTDRRSSLLTALFLSASMMVTIAQLESPSRPFALPTRLDIPELGRSPFPGFDSVRVGEVLPSNGRNGDAESLVHDKDNDDAAAPRLPSPHLLDDRTASARARRAHLIAGGADPASIVLFSEVRDDIPEGDRSAGVNIDEDDPLALPNSDHKPECDEVSMRRWIATLKDLLARGYTVLDDRSRRNRAVEEEFVTGNDGRVCDLEPGSGGTGKGRVGDVSEEVRRVERGEFLMAAGDEKGDLRGGEMR